VHFLAEIDGSSPSVGGETMSTLPSSIRRRGFLLSSACALVAVVAATAAAMPQQSPPLAGPAAATVSKEPHRRLATSPLVLFAPQLEAPLLSGMRATLRPVCQYTGHETLSYQLALAPAGMAVDSGSGAMQWTPPAALEGQQTAVTLSASDGVVTASVTFTVAVASATPVSTSVAGSTITVTQAGSLQGFAVTLPADASLPPAQVAVSTVSAGQAPAIPDGVTRISDFFRVTPVDGGTGMITLTLPTTHLPAGRSAEAIRLFVYSDAAENVGPGGVIDGSFWIRTWYGFDVLANGMATIKLQGLGDLAFIGVDAPAAGAPSPLSAISTGSVRVGTGTVSITCMPFVFSIGSAAVDIRACALSGDVTLGVIVKRFSQLEANPAATLNELLGWLASARTAFTTLGLGADPTFEVVVEKMPKPNWLGFVTTKHLEDRRVLHITNTQEDKSLIQGTAVHEYFHHAQSRTKVAGLTNMLDVENRQWMTEGTAQWFEDYLFDTLDTYRLTETQPLPQVLTWGLASPVQTRMVGKDEVEIPQTRAYARFAFWKMIESHCKGFSLPPILNCDTSDDPACLANFKAAIESPAWQCNFGGGLDNANKATLASALLYYTFATAKEDTIVRLDGNEPYFAFAGPSGFQLLQASSSCTSFAACPAASIHAGFLDSAAAIPFLISAVPVLDPGQRAVVEVKSDGAELWAWVADAEQSGFLTGGAWSKTTASWSNIYKTSGRAPKTMVVLVNPDPGTSLKYKIRAGIEAAPQPILTANIGAYVFQPAASLPYTGGDGQLKFTKRSGTETYQIVIAWTPPPCGFVGIAEGSAFWDPAITFKFMVTNDYAPTYFPGASVWINGLDSTTGSFIDRHDYTFSFALSAQAQSAGLPATTHNLPATRSFTIPVTVTGDGGDTPYHMRGVIDLSGEVRNFLPSQYGPFTFHLSYVYPE
jgi:hypothetical protein